MQPAIDDRLSSRADGSAVAAAQAVYTPLTLPLYDFVVHGLSNRLAWRCPTQKLTDLYRRNLSSRHLEAACGTGLFIDRADPAAFERLVLLDLNPHCLAHSAARLARYRPELRLANLLEPLELGDQTFDSIGLTYVLHCLPGKLTQKLASIDHLRPCLREGGVLFGATILGQGVPLNPAARALIALYNAKGVFNNRRDDIDALERGLRDRFRKVEVETIGCVARFCAS
jgi:SAM-dependent methyltransferase